MHRGGYACYAHSPLSLSFSLLSLPYDQNKKTTQDAMHNTSGIYLIYMCNIHKGYIEQMLNAKKKEREANYVCNSFKTITRSEAVFKEKRSGGLFYCSN